MIDPFAVFEGRARGVIWGKKKGDFRIDAPGSMARHEEVARELGIKGGRLIFPVTENGANIGVYGKTPLQSLDYLRWRTREACDGFIVSSNGRIGLAFMPADCYVIVMAGERRNESLLGLLHCGWRGILGGIIGRAINLFCQFGIIRQEIRLLVTPGIGSCCFEAGPDVLEQFWKKFPDLRWRSRTWEDAPSINLRRLIREEIVDSDIRHFTLMGGCTKCDKEKFWSHRRGNKERNIVAAALSQ